jgi:allophanate hydrolase subunit 1
VTTKYNPARTWTAENSVGIGGAYLCVYGMEGPGGYQFVGRTLQMWNRYHEVADFAGKPWLLRFSTSCVSIRFLPRNCCRSAAISRSAAIRCALSTARCGWRNTSSFSAAKRKHQRVSRASAAGV